MKKIDARGLACPLPVIQTKKALKENETVTTLVDNEIATQNLRKLAEQLNYIYQCEKISDVLYRVTISTTGNEVGVNKSIAEETVAAVKTSDEYTVVVDTDVMGRGSDELGANLLKTFIYALTEQDVLPKRAIFYNGGVKLTAENPDTISDLKTLAEAGVEIYACGACLDFYGLKEDIQVGEITNMYRIVEMMREANRIVKP
ncbi:sulfurtransferase-like selenium metabolism protein YedF [Vagococcus vulneris]|uniref:Sulfurtransferase-like selenium metabolism protein YedF n=1 Tax=Vagococcus vulneris TaxID=1977869 RepID=A0A429ZXQ0_9ENTE|nr:sulfurtransferase-like selenium metabolism protein YedF [Vagococcus vulneris]RST98595.1 sulfurtransferase-like selenium metabolism protein YedF [Vagococcus vulneris]